MASGSDSRRTVYKSWKAGNLTRADLLEIADHGLIDSPLTARIAQVFALSGSLVRTDLSELAHSGLVDNLLTTPLAVDFGTLQLSTLFTHWRTAISQLASVQLRTLPHCGGGGIEVKSEGPFIDKATEITQKFQSTAGLFEAEGTWWCQVADWHSSQRGERQVS